MIRYLSSMFTSAKAKTDRPRMPDGQRAYAVGDVHGRLDLFEALVDAIEADIADGEADGVSSQVILLGDLVDRGPDSAGVVKRARKWTKARDVRVLAGNHEEMFVEAFRSKDMLKHFLRHGGRETLLSYGMDRKAFSRASIDELQAMMADTVPAKHRKFIEGFEDMVQLGDYVFVHAGIEPGVPLEQQETSKLRWIREPFLSHRKSHGVVVVHGHTITDDVVVAPNRIGIDTGAYASGRLTALVLEGRKRRLLSARETAKGKITIDSANLAD
ncbi:MAG: metallophosphoesterase [Alteraurantiacibacter sp.]